MTNLKPREVAKLMPVLPLTAISYPAIATWQTIKAIEWILLAITVMFIVVEPSFYHSTTSSTITGITATSLFLLSLNPPIDRPLLWRQIYIVCSLGLANVGDGIHSSFSFVASFILLKACLLLPRRDVIWVAIVAWVMMMIGINQRMPNNFALLRQFGVEPFLDRNKILIENTLAHIGNCVDYIR
jgi:hypothetical protein